MEPTDTNPRRSKRIKEQEKTKNATAPFEAPAIVPDNAMMNIAPASAMASEKATENYAMPKAQIPVKKGSDMGKRLRRKAPNQAFKFSWRAKQKRDCDERAVKREANSSNAQ